MFSILRTQKKLTIAYIHRLMLVDAESLAADLGIKAAGCISYSQLQRITKSIDYECFNYRTFATHENLIAGFTN